MLESFGKCTHFRRRNEKRYNVRYSINPAQRFIPYIQLHEFEALLFTDINVLKYDFLEQEDVLRINQLYEETKEIPPEEINHGEKTAPSKRLLHTINYQKGEAVSEWLAVIGIENIQRKYPHFSEWITKLQILLEL